MRIRGKDYFIVWHEFYALSAFIAIIIFTSAMPDNLKENLSIIEAVSIYVRYNPIKSIVFLLISIGFGLKFTVRESKL